VLLRDGRAAAKADDTRPFPGRTTE